MTYKLRRLRDVILVPKWLYLIVEYEANECAEMDGGSSIGAGEIIDMSNFHWISSRIYPYDSYFWKNISTKPQEYFIKLKPTKIVMDCYDDVIIESYLEKFLTKL